MPAETKTCPDCRVNKSIFTDYSPRWRRCKGHSEFDSGCPDCVSVRDHPTPVTRCKRCAGLRQARTRALRKVKRVAKKAGFQGGIEEENSSNRVAYVRSEERPSSHLWGCLVEAANGLVRLEPDWAEDPYIPVSRHSEDMALKRGYDALVRASKEVAASLPGTPQRRSAALWLGHVEEWVRQQAAAEGPHGAETTKLLKRVDDVLDTCLVRAGLDNSHLAMERILARHRPYLEKLMAVQLQKFPAMGRDEAFVRAQRGAWEATKLRQDGRPRWDPVHESGTMFGTVLFNWVKRELRRTPAKEAPCGISFNVFAAEDGDRQVEDRVAAKAVRQDSSDAATAWARRQDVQSALSMLPPQMGEIVRRRFLLDHSPKEIAADLGMSSRTLNLRLQRALALLRELFLSDHAPRTASGLIG